MHTNKFCKRDSLLLTFKEIKEEETLCLCSVNAYHFHLAELREKEKEANSSSTSCTVNTPIEIEFKRDRISNKQNNFQKACKLSKVYLINTEQ